MPAKEKPNCYSHPLLLCFSGSCVNFRHKPDTSFVGSTSYELCIPVMSNTLRLRRESIQVASNTREPGQCSPNKAEGSLQGRAYVNAQPQPVIGSGWERGEVPSGMPARGRKHGFCSSISRCSSGSGSKLSGTSTSAGASTYKRSRVSAV